MPITMDDVKRILGPNPVVDPFSVMTEIGRRMPASGQELDGIRKDMTIKKVVQDILEQPQISGQSKWEDRFLYMKGEGATLAEKKAWMEKSYKKLSIPQNEHAQFFTWLKSFEQSPFEIEDVDDLHKTIKVVDKNTGLFKTLTFGTAINQLQKSMGWSNADVFEYWDWKKSMLRESAQVMFTEMLTPTGYRLHYADPQMDAGFVEISKGVLANKSFIAPDLRGREVVTVLHKNMDGRYTELGEFWGTDAPQRAHELASKFANNMAKGIGSGMKKAGKALKTATFGTGSQEWKEEQAAKKMKSGANSNLGKAMSIADFAKAVDNGRSQQEPWGNAPEGVTGVAPGDSSEGEYPVGSIMLHPKTGQYMKNVAPGQWVPFDMGSQNMPPYKPQKSVVSAYADANRDRLGIEDQQAMLRASRGMSQDEKNAPLRGDMPHAFYPPKDTNKSFAKAMASGMPNPPKAPDAPPQPKPPAPQAPQAPQMLRPMSAAGSSMTKGQVELSLAKANLDMLKAIGMGGGQTKSPFNLERPNKMKNVLRNYLRGLAPGANNFQNKSAPPAVMPNDQRGVPAPVRPGSQRGVPAPVDPGMQRAVPPMVGPSMERQAPPARDKNMVMPSRRRGTAM